METMQNFRDGLFFLVGNHRGGTTLLQSMLSSHSALTLPPETSYFLQVWPRRTQWGDVRDEQRWRQMLHDLASDRFATGDLQFAPERIGELLSSPEVRSADSLFVTLLADYAAQRGKRRAGDKSPQHIFCVPLLAELFPQAKFITILRDPRAVAASELRTTWGSRSVGRIVRKWNRVVDQHVRLQQQLPASRYHFVQYETLVTQPAVVLQRVCDFLGEEFEPAMLRYYDRPAHEQGFGAHEEWKFKTLKPLDAERIESWRDELPLTTIALIQQVAGARLSRLGYQTCETRGVSPLALCRACLLDAATSLYELVRGVVRPPARRAPWLWYVRQLLGSRQNP